MSDAMHEPGDVIADRYEIVSYIGEGGMQEVYHAADRVLVRDVALKTPKNASAKKRFERSAVVSARVNHANVAKTLDYVIDGERAYLIEELVDGLDLGESASFVLSCVGPSSYGEDSSSPGKGSGRFPSCGSCPSRSQAEQCHGGLW